MMQDYKEIKAGAELRVHKDMMFNVEFKNPGEKTWQVHLMYGHPESSINLAKEISKAIHEKPMNVFKVVYDND